MSSARVNARLRQGKGESGNLKNLSQERLAAKSAAAAELYRFRHVPTVKDSLNKCSSHPAPKKADKKRYAIYEPVRIQNVPEAVDYAPAYPRSFFLHQASPSVTTVAPAFPVSFKLK